MESLSNPQTNGNLNPLGSNVELNLLGIDKKWVRYNGSWVDKSTIPVEPVKQKEPAQAAFEEFEGSTSRWWQFWKA
jgi:hypothetical protein